MDVVDAIDKVLFSTRIRRCAEELGQQGTGALGRLFDLASPRLVRYALTVTHNQHDAEDALQAALVRIALKPALLAAAWHPWAYFLKVVRNEALKIVRRKKLLRLFATVTEGTEPDTQSPDDDTRQFVRAAINKLPREQSEVIVLKIWEEMTFLEIAEVLGESPNTIASRYRYALQKLTHHLQPLADEVPYAR